MSDSALKIKIIEDMKQAMRDQTKPRLSAIRLITAAIKQKEVDERIELSEQDILAILDKMLKQRRESIRQYELANRQDLVAQESFEIEIIQTYLPQPLSIDEVNAYIAEAMIEAGAKNAQDMGKVMTALKPKIQGRADMSVVSQIIKTKLATL